MTYNYDDPVLYIQEIVQESEWCIQSNNDDCGHKHGNMVCPLQLVQLRWFENIGFCHFLTMADYALSQWIDFAIT